MDIDIRRTAIILIGTSAYSEDFKNIIQVENNIAQLENLVRQERILGIPSKNVFKLLNSNNSKTLRTLKQVYQSNKYDTVITYYSGHGYRYSYSELFLLSPNSYKEDIEVTGLSFNILKSIIDISLANQKILILDCCHSGIATMNDPTFLTLTESEIKGTYILCSCSFDSLSYYDENDKFTFFTNELVDLLRYGKESARSYLTMNDIYNEIKNRLKNKKLPEPTKKENLNVVDYNVFKNVKVLREKYKSTEISNKQETSFWQTTKRLNEVEAYKNYIRMFPNGLFIDDANFEIKRLTGKISKKELKENGIRRFHTIRNFTQFNLAPASYNGKYGYINRDWQEVIPFMYDWASTFSNGTAEVHINGRTRIIDKNGNFLK